MEKVGIGSRGEREGGSGGGGERVEGETLHCNLCYGGRTERT